MTRGASAHHRSDGPQAGDAGAPSHDDLVDEKIIVCYYVAALTFLTISMLAGLLVALQLVHWNPFKGTELLSPGRWRMIHTNAIAYGFLANAFLGTLHWAVPRLTFHKVFSKPLSWFIFGAWQVVVLSTAFGIVLGPTFQDQPWILALAKKWHLPMNLGAQGLEWGETPFWIDPVALVGLALVAVNFMVPIGKSKGPMYVSLWYFMAAFVWTFLTYAMGNLLPEYAVAGTSAGAIGGLFIHDLVGLFVTPLGWGLMYYFVPIILKKPIWSHGLSLVGFWGLAFFYPLQGIHHFLYTPIPMFLQYGAVISTIAVELVVATVVINFFGTLSRDSGWSRAWNNTTLRFVVFGLVAYTLALALQILFSARSLNAIVRFTSFAAGQQQLLTYAGAFWPSAKLVHLHFWSCALAVVGSVAGSLFFGWTQGAALAAAKPFAQTMHPQEALLSSACAVLFLIGHVAFALNALGMLTTCSSSTDEARQA